MSELSWGQPGVNVQVTCAGPQSARLITDPQNPKNVCGDFYHPLRICVSAIGRRPVFLTLFVDVVVVS